MNTTALAAALGAALVVGAHLAAVAVRRRPAAEPVAEAPARRAPRYVAPDAGAFTADLGQLVMTADALGVAAQSLDDAPAMVGRVVGNPRRGRQIWITWADGSETYGDFDEFVGVRLATAEERATSLVFLADVPPMPRYELWGPFYDHSTDGLIGHGVYGYADELPPEDERDGEVQYDDRWHLATIQGPGCSACPCIVQGWGDEPPF